MFSISSSTKEDFVKEYRLALEETKGISGVVYVFKSEKLVPRGFVAQIKFKTIKGRSLEF